MPTLTQLAHEALRPVIQPGDVAIDATAGNGHDTLFLAGLVGPTGHVYAFDVQSEALEQTRLLLEPNCLERVTLLQADHAELKRMIPSREYPRISGIVWNLGYLPGGEKHIVTQADSTRRSLQDGLEILRSGGVATVLAYPGHPGGREECALVEHYLNQLPENSFEVRMMVDSQNPGLSPRLFVIHKQDDCGITSPRPA